MKKLLLSLTMLLATYLSFGQYYMIPTTNNGSGSNPGNLFSGPEQPGTYAAAPWTAAFATMPTTASWSNTINVPFTINFNGNGFNQVKVSNSGVLTFDVSSTAAPAYGTRALPASGVPDNSICVLGLQNQGANDLVYTATLGTSPNRQFWVAYSSYGQAVANWTSATLNRWTYWAIVLEETTNNVYIIDQRTGNVQGATTAADNVSVSVGLQFSSSSALSVPGSPALNSKNLSTGSSLDDATDNTIYAFFQGVQPVNGIKLTGLTLPRYHSLTGPALQVQAEAQNIGTSTINSYVVNYRANNLPIVSDTIRSVNIASLASSAVNPTTRFTPSAAGTVSLKLWISDLNGSALSSSDTLRGTFEVVDTILTRRILQEGFSSSTCPPCSLGNVVQRQAEAGNEDKIVRIKLQQNYPAPGTDPNQTSEAISRHGYYAINGIPHLVVDGTKFNGNSQSYTSALLNTYAADPAFVKIKGKYKVSGRKVDVTLDLTPYINLTGNSLYLHVAIREKDIRHNVATNGETFFKHVLRKMVPDQNGTFVAPLTARTSRSYTLSYTFPNTLGAPLFPFTPTNINFDSLEVAAWVQNVDTKEVLQAAELDVDLPALAATTFNVNNGKLIAANKATKFSVSVKNAGLLGINSAKLNYSINNGATKTVEFSNLAMGRSAVRTLVHDSTFRPSSAGSATVRFWLTELNGDATSNPFCDTITKTFTILNNSTTRVSLVETFTSSGLNDALNLNPIVDAAARRNPNAANVRYSMNRQGYTDPLTTTFGNDRYNSYMGGSSTSPLLSTPMVYVDGRRVESPFNLTKAGIDAIANDNPAFFNISGTLTRLATTSFRVNATITPVENIPAMNAAYFAIFGERYNTHNQATNGEVDFFDPVIVVSPNATAGQAATAAWNTTTPLAVTVNRQINSTSSAGIYSRDSVYCVLVLQDMDTKEVLQAAYINGVIASNPTDINSVINRVYPNPSNGNNVAVEFNLEKDADVTVSVFNTIGAKVAELKQGRLSAGAQKTVLNVNKLPQGIYTVKVQAGSEVSTDRLVITK